jgi:hypothetical protein
MTSANEWVLVNSPSFPSSVSDLRSRTVGLKHEDQWRAALSVSPTTEHACLGNLSDAEHRFCSVRSISRVDCLAFDDCQSTTTGYVSLTTLRRQKMSLLTISSTTVGWNWTVRVIALCQFLLLSVATILLRLRPRPATKVEAPPAKKHMFYWRAFATHPVYLLTSISSFCFSFGYFVFLFFVGTFALQKGWVKEAPYVLIACNAASAIGRIGAGCEYHMCLN